MANKTLTQMQTELGTRLEDPDDTIFTNSVKKDHLNNAIRELILILKEDYIFPLIAKHSISLDGTVTPVSTFALSGLTSSIINERVIDVLLEENTTDTITYNTYMDALPLKRLEDSHYYESDTKYPKYNVQDGVATFYDGLDAKARKYKMRYLGHPTDLSSSSDTSPLDEMFDTIIMSMAQATLLETDSSSANAIKAKQVNDNVMVKIQAING